MKLGEALSLRATQSQKLQSLSQRLLRAATYQDGTSPAENAEDLLNEFNALSARHAALVRSITRTNVSSGIDEQLAQREHLRRQVGLLHAALQNATSLNASRWARNEIVMLTDIPVADWQTAADDMEEEIRILDAQIQERNWSTDLI